MLSTIDHSIVAECHNHWSNCYRAVIGKSIDLYAGWALNCFFTSQALPTTYRPSSWANPRVAAISKQHRIILPSKSDSCIDSQMKDILNYQYIPHRCKIRCIGSDWPNCHGRKNDRACKPQQIFRLFDSLEMHHVELDCFEWHRSSAMNSNWMTELSSS